MSDTKDYNKQPKIELNLLPGESFVRVAYNEQTGCTEFTCGIYPSMRSEDEDFDSDSEIDPDMMLSMCIAGIAHFLQYDPDTLMRAGGAYIAEGNEVFDLIVDQEDTEYYSNLTEEQMQLLNMQVKGEA